MHVFERRHDRPEAPSALQATGALVPAVFETGGTVSRARRTQAFATTACFGLFLWIGLTGGDTTSLVFGVPAILAAGALAFAAATERSWHISPAGALRFCLYFAVQSLLGAGDVARRALSWRMNLDPGLVRYEDGLPAGAPRILFANAVTLLPGTLSAELGADHVIVHALDTKGDVRTELSRLEDRVRDLFALSRREVAR